MYGDNGKTGFIDTGTPCQQFHQRQRVLASRKPDKNLIAVLYQPIFHHTFAKPLVYAAQHLFFFSKSCH